jgi:hypothetical protein
MAKTPTLPDPGLDAKLDEAFGATPGGKLVSQEEYDWLQRMKKSNYQDVTAAPEAEAGSPFGLTPASAVEDPRMGIPEGWQMAPTLIARVLAEVGPVVKSQTNTHQNYNFRGIDQVVNAVNAAFKKHRIFPTSKIEFFQVRDAMTTANKPTREATLRVTYRFTAPDGSYVETEVPGEALDTSDKTTPKAMSVALRIALLQMLLLPTDEPTTDHDYLTRDGVGAMAPTTTKYLLDRLCVAPLEEVIGPIRAMISEHSAWDRHPIEGQATWAANFADRLSWIVDELPNQPAVNATHAALDAAKLLNVSNGKGTMVDQLKARWMQLRDLYVGTLNHVTGQILAARGVDELEIAISCGHAALEAGSLREADLAKAEAIAEERRPKLPEHAPQPEADPAEVLDSINADLDRAEAEPAQEPAQEDAQRHVGDFQDALKAFALRAAQAPLAGLGEEPGIREHAVHCAITALLEGDDTGPGASPFGAHGWQLVKDAIAAAHRREQSIGDGARHELDEAVKRYMAAVEAR